MLQVFFSCSHYRVIESYYFIAIWWWKQLKMSRQHGWRHVDKNVSRNKRKFSCIKPAPRRSVVRSQHVPLQGKVSTMVGRRHAICPNRRLMFFWGFFDRRSAFRTLWVFCFDFAFLLSDLCWNKWEANLLALAVWGSGSNLTTCTIQGPT